MQPQTLAPSSPRCCGKSTHRSAGRSSAEEHGPERDLWLVFTLDADDTGGWASQLPSVPTPHPALLAVITHLHKKQRGE